MQLNGTQIGAILVVSAIVVVAFFPGFATEAAQTLLGLILLIVIFGVIPLWWQNRRR